MSDRGLCFAPIELEGLECVLSHVTRNDYGKSKWYQHVGKKTAKKSQWRVLHSSLPCFLEMFSQISCIYFGDRVTATNLKSFMMDLAVILAEFQRESCVLYRKTTHFASK